MLNVIEVLISRALPPDEREAFWRGLDEPDGPTGTAEEREDAIRARHERERRSAGAEADQNALMRF